MDSVPCIHPVVAVAHQVKGYSVLGETDIDVHVSTLVLALPTDFGKILDRAVQRREGLTGTVQEIRLCLLDSLSMPKLFEPDLNSIRTPLIG